MPSLGKTIIAEQLVMSNDILNLALGLVPQFYFYTFIARCSNHLHWQGIFWIENIICECRSERKFQIKQKSKKKKKTL